MIIEIDCIYRVKYKCDLGRTSACPGHPQPYDLEQLHVLFLGPVTETRPRARFIIWVGAFALATTAEIQQIQSRMYLQADVRKQASSALGARV